MKTLFFAIALAALPGCVTAADHGPAALKLERVVLLMRHGVRPPTKSPPMPAGVAAQAWPGWSVRPGYLTPHGADALRVLGTADRAGWIAAGLWPRTGCPSMRLIADSDERTISTARVYGEALTPGCAQQLEHKPQDVADAVFSPIDEGAVDYDPTAARAAVLADLGPGGLAAEQARVKPLLTRLDAILCGTARASCGLGGEPTGLEPARPGRRPKLSGRIDTGSTVAQILLLEYADAKPAADIGWGRASAADIATASELHAAEFRILARPRYVAARNAALFGEIMRAALVDEDAPSVTMLSGHDTNVASLGGLLDLHWQVPGLARDDPSPGGALLFERLIDAKGDRFVRAVYRSQSLDQIRTLARTAPYRIVMPLPGCSANGVAGLCTLAQFDTLMRARLVSAR